MISPVIHRLKIYQKIALHSNFSKFREQKVNKITRLLANFGVGHLNVAYIAKFARSSNFTFVMAEPEEQN